jgi:hypothetical protein
MRCAQLLIKVRPKVFTLFWTRYLVSRPAGRFRDRRAMSDGRRRPALGRVAASRPRELTIVVGCRLLEPSQVLGWDEARTPACGVHFKGRGFRPDRRYIPHGTSHYSARDEAGATGPRRVAAAGTLWTGTGYHPDI